MKQLRWARSSAVGAVDVVTGPSTRKIALKFNIWPWVFVYFPGLLAAVYYFGIASDLYMSEARIIVRSQGQNSTSVLGTVLQGMGLQQPSGGPDVSAVVSFITSRDAARDLELRDHLRDIFNRPEADFITRFPHFFSSSSFEALYNHYLNFVDVETDPATGVTTLQVKAYRPEDAQAITQALIRYSEQLVNALNARAEKDALQLARHEVDEAEQNLANAQQQLTAYRFRQQILDPKLTSTSVYRKLNELTTARTETETQLAELTKDSPNTPAIPSLKTRLVALDRQLDDTMRSVTGNSDSVAGKLGEYERLNLAQEIGEKLLESAVQSLETARLEAERKHLYVEHIAEPNLPDYPLYPKRILSFFIVLVSCLVAYGVAWLMIAGIREHGSA
jgi:capsular polysaccharide transport system permease protein